ncbi:hypothetical protein L345_09815, partial [Ophiophagus hannah]
MFTFPDPELISGPSVAMDQYPSDHELVSVIAEGMNEGDASDWIAQLHNKGPAKLDDADEFVQLLRGQFEDPDQVNEKEAIIKVMKQGNKSIKDVP